VGSSTAREHAIWLGLLYLGKMQRSLLESLGKAVFRTTCLLLLIMPSRAAQPLIGKIELYSSNQVLVHFDVQPNTTCTLQWTDGVKNQKDSPVWWDLWVSPNLPFFEHYIIQDTRTKTR